MKNYYYYYFKIRHIYLHAIEIEFAKHAKSTDVRRHRAHLRIVAKIEFGEIAKAADLGRQLVELRIAQRELRQRSHCRQRRQAFERRIVTQINLLQIGQRRHLLWQLTQLVEADIQHDQALDVADLSRQSLQLIRIGIQLFQITPLTNFRLYFKIILLLKRKEKTRKEKNPKTYW